MADDAVLQSPTNPHFFQPLLPGYHSHMVLSTLVSVSSSMNIAYSERWFRLFFFSFCMLLQNIPVAFFLKHVQGRNGDKTARLRSDASDTTWEVVINGRRLTGGWKEFVKAHDLRVGDVLVFRHEGELVFHVTALGSSCCEV